MVGRSWMADRNWCVTSMMQGIAVGDGCAKRVNIMNNIEFQQNANQDDSSHLFVSNYMTAIQHSPIQHMEWCYSRSSLAGGYDRVCLSLIDESSLLTLASVSNELNLTKSETQGHARHNCQDTATA